MITATNTITDDFSYDDSKENYLLHLLSRTVYSMEKRRAYENVIGEDLSQAEYEMFVYQFRNDRIDEVTMLGTGGMREISNHLKKLR